MRTGSAERLYDVHVEEDVVMQARDGTRLYADVYRPAEGGPFPVILMRTPYDKRAAQADTYAHPLWYARHGYMVVVQDARGRWRSEGTFTPFAHEADDGYDAVEWAARLPGSSGKVGMYGFSYVGATQLLAATRRPPGLVCICPGLTGSQYYEGWTYRSGAFALAFNLTWAATLAQDTARRRGLPDVEQRLRDVRTAPALHYDALPLRAFAPLRDHDIAPYYDDWLEHERYDEYWRRWSIDERYEQIDVPALHIAGWYDIFLDGTLRNYVGIRDRGATDLARRHQRLLVLPWYHSPWSSMVGPVDFGPEALNRIDSLQLRWFDRWLRGVRNGVDEEPPVEVFVMGASTWRRAADWPVPGTTFTDFYLHSDGRANSLSGDGALTLEPPKDEHPDTFVYDPRRPVLSLGGRSCCSPLITPMGPADQRPVEAGGSVLVYTSAPMEEDLEVTGPVAATLWAATTAVDTDWTVKLVDVHPAGFALNVADGIIRARFHESCRAPRLLRPGEVYRYEIDLGATGNLFRRGHRIRVEVSSSNFPCYDRNTNTGRELGVDTISDAITARQTIFHDAARPSHVRLPVAPR
ncbi:MAG: CocE/NonD family hydrolase [Armatimonadetes bacterium]|nr:CocE/NonD family hydrolase [Armatimonadota bacterium]